MGLFPRLGLSQANHLASVPLSVDPFFPEASPEALPPLPPPGWERGAPPFGPARVGRGCRWIPSGLSELSALRVRSLPTVQGAVEFSRGSKRLLGGSSCEPLSLGRATPKGAEGGCVTVLVVGLTPLLLASATLANPFRSDYDLRSDETTR